MYTLHRLCSVWNIFSTIKPLVSILTRQRQIAFLPDFLQIWLHPPFLILHGCFGAANEELFVHDLELLLVWYQDNLTLFN